MKRGVLLLLVILLVIPIALGVPANPLPYSCDETGDEECLTIGNQFYAEEYTVEEDNEGRLKLRCPIVRQIDADGIRRPYFGYIGDDGYLFPDTEFALSEFRSTEIQEREDFICGQENIRIVRPQMPPPPIRTVEDRNSNDRLKKNAELGMGLELQTNGEFVNINPTLKEAVDNYEILPPRLPEPQPEIIFLPTGAVTAQQSVQELKMLVVLVQFTDETAKTTKAEMEELFFGEDGFADFYEEQSYGALKITGDVVGWYDAPQTMGYYGDNYEYRVADLIEEAVDLANTDVDFSQYDGDGDGIVDSFFVVHAGEPDENGGGNGPEIWSHYYSISGKTVDGVKVVDYETVSEESPLGIIAHEFGHYLGLPDYYDTYYDDGTSKGAGDWSLMAYGAYVDEPVIDPWSKEYLGWLFSDNYLELSEDGYYDVAQDNAALGIKYYMIPLSSSESFYLENRHVHDLMKKNDAGGILIWHVDESIMEETGSWNGCTGTRWTCNTVNSNSEHLFVALEQADGEYDLESDDLGDVDDAWFSDCGFGSCSPAQFSSVSEPSSLGYYSSSYDVAVSVNSEIGSSMEIGVSFSGILLAPEEVEEVSTSGGVEVSDEEVESSSSSGSSSGMPSWVYVVIGVLIVVILGVVVFVGLGLLRKE